MNRKQRKLEFIRRKNRMYAAGGYKGIFFSYHSFEQPVIWADFSFFSRRFKKRFYSVAMINVAGMAAENDLNVAADKADKACSIDGSVPLLASFLTDEWINLCRDEEKILNARPQFIAPYARYFKEHYSDISSGISTVVDAKVLTQDFIVDWIERFCSYGEPQKNADGWLWVDTPVEVRGQDAYVTRY